MSRLLPMKSGKFFMTAEAGSAIEGGTLAVGRPYSGHAYVETERYMGLFHEVSPQEQALSCMDCHGEKRRLDFAALATAFQHHVRSDLILKWYGTNERER